MSDEPTTPSVDMIRWTFTADPARRDAIADYLHELGMEVLSGDDGRFLATWDEPGGDVDAVVERLWEINGATFDVTHEDFHRLDLAIYHSDDESDAAAA